jgi:transcriptional regulator with XRE-family HTH domain
MGFKETSSFLLRGAIMELRQAFAMALRKMRLSQGLTQEDFGVVSSRTYLSSLERGKKNATLEKASELAGRIGVHPLSLLVETFLTLEPDTDIRELLDKIQTEIAAVNAFPRRKTTEEEEEVSG